MYNYDEQDDNLYKHGGDIGETIKKGIKGTEYAAEKYEKGFAQPLGKKVGETITKGVKTTELAAKKYSEVVNPDAAVALGFDVLLTAAEKMPSWGNRLSNFFYNCNLVVAFLFDLILVYTLPTEKSIPPTSAGLLVKLLLIVATYAVVNIVLNVLVFTVFIPLYYKYYTNKYSNFSWFLEKQYKSYQSKFGVQFLEEKGDMKTIGILAAYPVVLNNTYNKTSNIDEYRKYIRDNIGTALKKIEADKTSSIIIDDALIAYVTDYFLKMPDNFLTYVHDRETFMSQTIQMWILMLCIILFFIPVKYTIVDVITEPKLPRVFSKGAEFIGNTAKTAGIAAASTMTKMSAINEAKVGTVIPNTVKVVTNEASI